MIFDFKNDYILEDEFVMLRPLQITDYEYLLPYSLNEPEIWSYNIYGAEGSEKLKHYIERAVNNRLAEKEYAFIVFNKKTNQYIGSTRFYDIFLDTKRIDIGWTWYGKAFQSTGINKNCKYLLLNFSFENLGMERVGLRANNANIRSKNAMKSIGCIEEGIMRNFNIDAQGNRIDVVVLSILRDEWYQTVKQNLKSKTLQ
jgi:N-acetyltransferase